MEKENNAQIIRKILRSLPAVILGNAVYAAAVVLFLEQSRLVTGGSTGIALAVYYATGFPTGTFVLIFNTIMLVAGWFFLGKSFALTTLVSTFVYPLELSLFERWMGQIVLTREPILNAIFAGLGIGLALAIVIRQGASTGGMDIPPLILHKLWNVNVSASMTVFDVVILLAQIFFRDAETILYGIVIVLIYTLTLDRLLLAGSSRIEVKVVSKQASVLRDTILRNLDRGVTMIHGEGGYSHEETELVWSVVSNRELAELEKIVHKMDPEAFMVVSRVTEVSGRGFTMKKRYGNGSGGHQ